MQIKLKAVITAALILLVINLQGWSETYYCDPINGNNAWNGLSAAYTGGTTGPWSSLEYAADNATNGSTVYCFGGNYGFVTIDRIGMVRSSIADAVTFIAGTGETPVLSGLTVKGPGNLLNPGRYRYTWDGREENGQLMGSGLYIVYMKTEGYEKKKKIAIIK